MSEASKRTFNAQPTDPQSCQICGRGDAPRQGRDGADGADYQVNCKDCGVYSISRRLMYQLKDMPVADKIRLSGAVRYLSYDCPVLTDATLSSVLSVAPRTGDVREQAKRLLSRAAKLHPLPGEEVHINSFSPADGYVADKKGIDFLWSFMLEIGWTIRPMASIYHIVQISCSGWEELSSRVSSASDSAFVAMWFGGDMDAAWETGIKPAVESCSWRAERIDLEEHNDDIVDRILGDIRGSRFLVADFTGHRQGVYFEAGFALGLGIPVIWVCHKDQIEDAHFDTNHFSHVVWETPEELREKLANRIRATIGEGTYQPPTQ